MLGFRALGGGPSIWDSHLLDPTLGRGPNRWDFQPSRGVQLGGTEQALRRARNQQRSDGTCKKSRAATKDRIAQIEGIFEQDVER